jgi:hypothetical protein
MADREGATAPTPRSQKWRRLFESSSVIGTLIGLLVGIAANLGVKAGVVGIVVLGAVSAVLTLLYVYWDKLGRSRVGGVNIGPARGASRKLMEELVNALRSDAAQLPSAEKRAEVRTLANKLEAEVDRENPNIEAIRNAVQQAELYSARESDWMIETRRVLAYWR